MKPSKKAKLLALRDEIDLKLGHQPSGVLQSNLELSAKLDTLLAKPDQVVNIPDTVTVTNPTVVPPYPEFPELPTSLDLNQPKWWKPLDLSPLTKTLAGGIKSITDTLTKIFDSLRDYKDPIKVNILDKKGNVIDQFGGRAISYGGGGGGHIEVLPRFNTGSNLSVTGTASQMTATSLVADFGVLIKASNTNGGTIYVGNSLSVTAGTTAATDGFELGGGESILVKVNNANLIYLIANTGTQKAFYIVI